MADPDPPALASPDPVRTAPRSGLPEPGSNGTVIDWDVLRAEARDACLKAYAPYSSFPVGAAAFTSDGRIVTGSNVENAS